MLSYSSSSYPILYNLNFHNLSTLLLQLGFFDFFLCLFLVQRNDDCSAESQIVLESDLCAGHLTGAALAAKLQAELSALREA